VQVRGMVRNFPSWLGRILRKMRPGVERAVIHHPDFAATPAGILLESSAIGQDGFIGRTHTDDGAGISPPLRWRGIPSNAAGLVLIVEDADSPTPSPFVHLLAWDLPARDNALDAGSFKSKGIAGADLKLGRNGMGKREYTPPDPLPGHGQHRYLFQLFALDTRLDFQSPPNKIKLKTAMKGHVVSKGMLTGTYERR
jgi:Raf kinase inhibitor-like YbhB/YbcL family protein